MSRIAIRQSALTLALLLVSGIAWASDVLIRQFTPEDGLANAVVWTIAMGDDGRLWIGTDDGLNRYDGYGFELFEHDPLDPDSLASNNVSQLLVEEDGTLWVGTWGSGLDHFDPKTGIAEHLTAVPGAPDALNDNRIQDLILDSEGAIWIGTYDGGLSRLDGDRQSIRTWRAVNEAGALSSDRVWAIAEDPQGDLWIGTEDGLNRMDRASGTFERFEGSEPFASEIIRSVTFDSKHRLWVGTEKGLHQVDFATGEVLRFQHDPKRTDSLPVDVVNEVIEDSRGSIWILTNDGGLAKFLPDTLGFRNWRHQSGARAGLGHDDLRTMIEDGSEVLWIGTRGGGLNSIDLKWPKFHTDYFDPADRAGLADPEVFAFLEDEDGTLWVGTTRALHRRRAGESGFERFDRKNTKSMPPGAIEEILRDRDGQMWLSFFRGGICRFDPAGGCVERFVHDPARPDSLSSDIATDLLEDSRGRFWVGTTQGLDLMDRDTGRFRRFSHVPGDSRSLADKYVTVILEDSAGDLWIGTDSGGLSRLAADSDGFVNYRSEQGAPGTLSSNRVNVAFEDRAGVLWIGTDYGLNRFDADSGTFAHLMQEDGLPRSDIRGILEDDLQQLWISTTGGLSRLDPTRTHFRNYRMRDGLQGDSFIRDSAHEGPSGQMYFGGAKGFSSFLPAEVVDNPYPPPIIVLSIEAGGRPVETDSFGAVTLRYQDNSISVRVAALDFTIPGDNRYAHKLEGFDREWLSDGTRRFIRYTNLPPGQYTLRVKASNNDLVWNEEGIALPIVIREPYWMATWFRLLVGLSVVLAAFLIHRVRVAALERSRRELERVVDERTVALREKNEQLERINAIVGRINREVDFDKVLEMMLEVSRALHGVDIAMAIVFDPLSGVYRVRAATGWDAAEIDDVSLSLAQVEAEYLVGAVEPFDDLFVRETSIGESVRLTITMRIVIGEEVAGFLVFESPRGVAEVDSRDLQLLHELKLHIHSAFLKATVMKELERISDSKNEFVAIAAHDLRTPLGVVVGWVSVVIDQLQSRRGDAQDAIAQLRNVQRAAEEMESLVRDLLDISAIESGSVNLEKIRSNFAKFVEVSVEPHRATAQQKGISITVDVELDEAHASFDPSRIAEVIDNLVSNAIKYTYPGGKIRVSCERIGDEIVTHVSDTGQGLTEEDQRMVFRTFKKLSSRPTGGEMSTGLGLAIVKKLVEIHGGRVWVTSVKGEGSTFSFALPAAGRTGMEQHTC